MMYKSIHDKFNSDKKKNKTLKSPTEEWGPNFVVLIILIWLASFFIGFTNGVIISTFLGIIMVFIGIRYPAIGLFGIGILCALDVPNRVLLLTGGLFRWNTFNYLLLITMIFNLTLLMKLKFRQIRIFQAFLIILSIELIYSSDIAGGLSVILDIITFLGFIVYFYRSINDKRAWYWMGLLTSILTATASVIYFLQISKIPYINPNAWAFFPLAGLIAINLGIPFAVSTRQKQIFFLLAVVNLSWIFLSGSRGCFIDGVICFFFLVMQVGGLSKSVVYLSIGGLLVILISNQFFDLQSNTLSRFGELTNPMYSLSASTSGRSDIFIAGWNIFLQHPFGVGTGGFTSAWGQLGDFGYTLRYYLEHPEAAAHSGWIKILAENGVPGFIFLFSFVFSFAAIGIRQDRGQYRLLGILVTVVFMIAFFFSEFQGKVLWFLASGVMLLLHEDNKISRNIRKIEGNKKTNNQ